MFKQMCLHWNMRLIHWSPEKNESPKLPLVSIVILIGISTTQTKWNIPSVYPRNKSPLTQFPCRAFIAGGCVHVHCGKGRECQVGADGAARCSCVSSCAKHRQHLVCGSDGHLYHNHCELHRASCLLRRPLAVDRTMACLNAGIKPRIYSDIYESEHGHKRTPKTTPERNKTRVCLCSTLVYIYVYRRI